MAKTLKARMPLPLMARNPLPLMARIPMVKKDSQADANLTDAEKRLAPSLGPLSNDNYMSTIQKSLIPKSGPVGSSTNPKRQ